MMNAAATGATTFAALHNGDTFKFAVAPHTPPLTKVNAFTYAYGKTKLTLDTPKTMKVFALN